MVTDAGWLPRQHGAWAMITVPLVVGLWHSVTWQPAGSDLRMMAGRSTLAVAFVLGFCCFNAVSLLLKASPRRRERYVSAAGWYAVAACAAGIVATSLLGQRLLLWGVAYAPIMAATLALAAARRERSLLSGGLTTLAASLFAATLLCPDPVTVLAMPGVLVTSAICFLYFFGTVFAVKTMIRQRGSRGWWAASIGFHALALALAVVATLGLGSHWWFVVFFAATMVRAAVLPMLGPLATPPRSVRPMTLGLVEIGFSIVLLLIFVLT